MKLVPEYLSESLKQVLAPPSKKSIKNEIDQKAEEYGIINPNKNVKLGDIQIIVDDFPQFKKELKAYGISFKIINKWIDGSPETIDMSGKRKAVGLWAIEKYNIESVDVNDFLDNTFYDD